MTDWWLMGYNGYHMPSYFVMYFFKKANNSKNEQLLDIQVVQQFSPE